jgi:hypothetical protein
MHEHPTQGMQGVKAAIKPRFKSAREELPEYSREYLIQRNGQMKAKNQTAQMLLAKARGELILKDLVEKQAAYLLVAMRQKMLGAPDAYCRRILNLSDPFKAKAILREMMISMLNELSDLPRKVVNPNWLK